MEAEHSEIFAGRSSLYSFGSLNTESAVTIPFITGTTLLHCQWVLTIRELLRSGCLWVYQNLEMKCHATHAIAASAESERAAPIAHAMNAARKNLSGSMFLIVLVG